MQQDSTSGAAPGWYPDPSRSDLQRYWDGEAWTESTAPAAWPGGPPAPTGPRNEPLAVSAFVFSIFGGFVFAIVFAFMARGRIKRSGGELVGKGFTTAALVISAGWVVAIGGYLALDAAGVLENRNADDFSGEEREVAEVIDRFEDGSPDTICDDLLTEDYRVTYRGFGGPEHCAERVADDDDRGEIDVIDIAIDGDTATVTAERPGQLVQPRITITLVRQGDEWRIASVGWR